MRLGSRILLFGSILLLLGLTGGLEVSDFHLGVEVGLQKGVSEMDFDWRYQIDSLLE